jgi:hypothetical protein
MSTPYTLDSSANRSTTFTAAGSSAASTEDIWLVEPRNREYVLGNATEPYNLPKPRTLPFLISIGVLLILLAFLINLTISTRNSEQRFAASSRAIQARVTALEDRSDSDGKEYRLGYSFRIGDDSYSGQQKVDFDTFTRYRVGDPITVRYAPENPARSEIEGQPRTAWGFFLFLSILVAVIIIGGFLVAIRRAGRYEAFRKNSTIILGTLEDFRAKVDSEDHYMVYYRYTFRDPDGALVTAGWPTKYLTASSAKNEWRDRPEPRIGQPVAVVWFGQRHHLLL